MTSWRPRHLSNSLVQPLNIQYTSQLASLAVYECVRRPESDKPTEASFAVVCALHTGCASLCVVIQCTFKLGLVLQVSMRTVACTPEITITRAVNGVTRSHGKQCVDRTLLLAEALKATQSRKAEKLRYCLHRGRNTHCSLNTHCRLICQYHAGTC